METVNYNDVSEPLKYWEKIASKSVEKKINETFDAYLQKCNINESEVNAISDTLKNEELRLQNNKSKRTSYIILLLFSIAVLCYIIYFYYTKNESNSLTDQHIIYLVISSVVCVVLLILSIVGINKTGDKLKEMEKIVEDIKNEIYQKIYQLKPLLNKNILKEISKVLSPAIVLNNNLHQDFLIQNDEILALNQYISQCTKNANKTSLAVISGTSFDAPFVEINELNHFMGTKTYTGSRVVSWQEEVYDSVQKQYVTHTETDTLFASYVAPYPMYNLNTKMTYLNQSCDKLCFTRTGMGASINDNSAVRKKIKQLDKKEKQDEKFTKLTNEEFDAIFGALDRNDEVQYRMMFSPLAQTNLLSLLKTTRGGDIYNILKAGPINLIELQDNVGKDVSFSPPNFTYDLRDIRKSFGEYYYYTIERLYFELAPMFTIPIYVENSNTKLEYFDDVKNTTLSIAECEVIANMFDRKSIASANTSNDVEVIPKIVRITNDGEKMTVDYITYSYSAHNRVYIEYVMARNGRTYDVPVYWVEYLPEKKRGQMLIYKSGEKNIEKAAGKKSIKYKNYYAILNS